MRDLSFPPRAYIHCIADHSYVDSQEPIADQPTDRDHRSEGDVGGRDGGAGPGGECSGINVNVPSGDGAAGHAGVTGQKRGRSSASSAALILAADTP